MNVLLLGGTGPMGMHLSELLSTQNDVFVTSRKPHKNKGNISFVQGNAKMKDFLSSVLSMRTWDCIVDFMAYTTCEFEERVELLLNSTKQYIFLSSARVYDNNNETITEDSSRLLDTSTDTAYLKTDEYALYKAREENILLNSTNKNYTIIRPYITYAENRFPMGVWEKETWLRRCLQKKDIVFPKTFLDKVTTLTYGRDVAKYISIIIGNQGTVGQIYNIVSNKSSCWSEILSYYLSHIESITGYRPKVTLVDSYVVCLQDMLKLWFSDIVSLGLAHSARKIRNKKYQLIYDREFNRKFDNKKLEKLDTNLNFISYEDILGDCLVTFTKNPSYQYRNWQWEAVQDRLTGQKNSLSEIGSLKDKIRYLLIRYLIPRKYMFKS